METGFRFLPLLLVVILAFAVPLLLSRFRRVPVVVGEILAGILIGRSWLGWVHGEEFTLEILSEIGFAFLMFISGLEINFSLLVNPAPGRGKQRLNPFTIALLSFLIASLLAGAAGWAFTQFGLARDPWMMALILSTTSLGIVLPILKERGLTGGQYGQTILLAALMADFFTMFLITMYVAIQSSGLTLDILLIGVLFVAVLLIYQIGVRQLRRPAVRGIIEELSGATSQVKVRGAMALMMAFVVLAEFLGVELILGAFLAGVVASLLSTPQDRELHHKLDAIGFGFFIPLFFIMVGVRFDLQAFLRDPSAWILAPLLLLSAYLLKLAAVTVFRVGFSWREALAAGVLLSARLSLIIAASAIGLRLGVISQSTNAAIILVAAITSMLSPMLFNALLPEQDDRQVNWFLIFGAEDISIQVAKVLHRHGEQVRFLEPDPRQVEQARRSGFEVIQADNIVDSLEIASRDPVKALLVLSADDTRNLLVSHAAVGLGIEHIVARVNDPARLPEYRSLGVSTYAPVLHSPTVMAMMARNPDVYALLTSTTDEQDVREVFLRNPLWENRPLSTLGLPGNLLILSIGRDGELIIPHGNTRLQLGDRLAILGDFEELQEAVEWLESREAG